MEWANGIEVWIDKTHVREYGLLQLFKRVEYEPTASLDFLGLLRDELDNAVIHVSHTAEAWEITLPEKTFHARNTLNWCIQVISYHAIRVSVQSDEPCFIHYTN